MTFLFGTHGLCLGGCRLPCAVQFRSVWCQQQSDNCSLPGACGQMFHLANFVLTAGLCGGQVTGTAQHAASTISPHAWSATSAPAQGEPTLASWEDDQMLPCCMCCLIVPLHSGHGRPLPPEEDSALTMILCRQGCLHYGTTKITDNKLPV